MTENREPVINPNLRAMIHRQRCQRQMLVKHLATLPMEAQLELFRLLQDLEMEVANERRKRKQGRFF